MHNIDWLGRLITNFLNQHNWYANFVNNFLTCVYLLCFSLLWNSSKNSSSFPFSVERRQIIILHKEKKKFNDLYPEGNFALFHAIKLTKRETNKNKKTKTITKHNRKKSYTHIQQPLTFINNKNITCSVCKYMLMLLFLYYVNWKPNRAKHKINKHFPHTHPPNIARTLITMLHITEVVVVIHIRFGSSHIIRILYKIVSSSDI